MKCVIRKRRERCLFGILGAWRGRKGYGYLPYDFVLTGLAEDWWTLIDQGWFDTGQFGE
jgi:C1A family cysteine protease